MITLITGLVIGTAAAALVAQALRTQLYHVSPLDPVSYAIAPLVFVVAGLAAAYFPSRRATMVDPVIALRQE